MSRRYDLVIWTNSLRECLLAKVILDDMGVVLYTDKNKIFSEQVTHNHKELLVKSNKELLQTRSIGNREEYCDIDMAEYAGIIAEYWPKIKAYIETTYNISLGNV